MQHANHDQPDGTAQGTTAGPPAPTLVIVRARPPAGFSAHDARRVAEHVRGGIAAMQGLRRKYFSYSAARHEIVNVYEWTDGGAAAATCHPDFVARIRAAYGVEPEITVAEVLAIAQPAGTGGCA